jgi:hypothetical protein
MTSLTRLAITRLPSEMGAADRAAGRELQRAARVLLRARSMHVRIHSQRLLAVAEP